MNSTTQIIRECLKQCRAQWTAWLGCRHATESEIELAKTKVMLIDGALDEIEQAPTT